jgi:HrpA-like RNA helicase
MAVANCLLCFRKTTQIPQFIIDQNRNAKIIVCQPRRLAAVGVATRVAEEQSTAIGDRVGYMVKGDSKVSKFTNIVFCTYGVLLRRLQVTQCSSCSSLRSGLTSLVLIDRMIQR